MDELKSFFNNPSSSRTQPVRLRPSLTGGVYVSKEDNLNELSRKPEHRRAVMPSGTDYAREVREKENNRYLQQHMENKQYDSLSGGLESLEHLTSLGSNLNVGELTDEAMTEVYSKYSFKKKEDTINLPINGIRQDVLDGINGFSVVFIEGPTGCGKTTQVPQWILDESHKNQRPCRIVVTQPRRIAAISIAKRVAQERGWNVGELVGYQVGLENKTSADSRITYVTTGVLLQKLVALKTMNYYSHIILDEVHERGQDMDFLLLVVKKLLFTVSPNVKVILMSATFNSQAFAEYFSIPNPYGLPTSTCVQVPKSAPMYEIKINYLNQLNKFSSEALDKSLKKGEQPWIPPEMHHLTLKLLNAFEQIDADEEYEDREEANIPSVLIFLPGINEIEDLYNCLVDHNLRRRLCGEQCVKYKWSVLPLHSTITADEQARVFHHARPGHRKIIIATNIAESSITVPDIKYVIDYCLMKTLVADENTNFTSLQLTWASKTNCEQRAGRSGRVRDGRVYRLVTDTLYNSLKDEPVPEIVRCPLERLVLLAKMLDMGPPSDILALAMDPPDMSNIRRTLLVLKEIGALKKTVDDEWSTSDGDITYLGRIMAKLPMDVKVSKLIIMGYIFGCLEESIIMAAAMSVKNVFNSPFLERVNAFNSRLTWADGSTSDCIAFYNVYKVWRHLRTQNYFKQQGNNEVQWARRFYVQVRSLREMDAMVRELRNRLSREGIEGATTPTPYNKQEMSLVLKVIIAGAFYPQYFTQLPSCEDRERDAVKTLGGFDPRDTVYLQDFPDNQPGEIYATAIKRAIKEIIKEEPRVVTFDKNSRKIFLTFGDSVDKARREGSGDPTIPGQVLVSVYKAVKARTHPKNIRIRILPLEEAQEMASALEISKMELSSLESQVPRLPEVDETHFQLVICQPITVSKFWVQMDDDSTRSELHHIHVSLNSGQLIAHTGPVRAGDLYAAPHNNVMRRARVTRLLPRDVVEVMHIDWGLTTQVNACNLRVVTGELCRGTPPLAMRCRLAGVAPAPLLDAHGAWSLDAVRRFQACVARPPLLAKVYSVVHGVVAIELLANGGHLNVNQELLKAGVAIALDESYESKLNHDLRQTANELNNAQKRAYNKEQTQMAYDQLREVHPSIDEGHGTEIVLKGPFSPLETSVYTLMYGSRERVVHIDWESVNAVLLDTDPQQPHERLVVAATVSQSENSGNLTIRQTTIMPNIPGLPAIMALLFCPSAELRRTTDGTRYVSVLCGLGSDEDGAPYFPEHDLLVNIDADIDVSDISAINHIRHLMDYMISFGENQDLLAADDSRAQIPKIIRTELLMLLKKRRKHREPQAVVNAWNWKSSPEDEILEVSDASAAASGVIFPFHEPLQLHPVPRDLLRALYVENENLKQLVGRTPISSRVLHTCTLCGTPALATHAMRIHLYSNTHLEKEEDLHMFHS